MPWPVLPRSFYLDPPDLVAQRLLGKRLVRRYSPAPGQKSIRLAGRIVEAEAYFGLDDPAAHAFSGKTPRNAVLFGPPGVAYVYFIYGMHFCLNICCEPAGRAGCILLRALEPLEGIDVMTALRNLAPGAQPIASGPGRLCQALAITRESHNGVDVTRSASTLHVEDDGFTPPAIAASPRIGIRKAADRPLRFSIPGNPCVSR